VRSNKRGEIKNLKRGKRIRERPQKGKVMVMMKTNFILKMYRNLGWVRIDSIQRFFLLKAGHSQEARFTLKA